jgi:hypothetical protein
MDKLIKTILRLLGQPHRVDFDYRDQSGMHHGRCYVRYFFSSEQRVIRLMRSFGYSKIHIV